MRASSSPARYALQFRDSLDGQYLDKYMRLATGFAFFLYFPGGFGPALLGSAGLPKGVPSL